MKIWMLKTMDGQWSKEEENEDNTHHNLILLLY